MDLPGAHPFKDWDRETSREIFQSTEGTRHEGIGSGAESWLLEGISDSEHKVISDSLT